MRTLEQIKHDAELKAISPGVYFPRRTVKIALIIALICLAIEASPYLQYLISR